MNRKCYTSLRLFILFALIVISPAFACAQDGLPIGWNVAGSKPANYEMKPDSAVKHRGQASACLKFSGQKAEGRHADADLQSR